jgi:hypothetical protein
MKGWLMYDKIEEGVKGISRGLFKVSRYLPERTQDSLSPDRDLNSGSLQYEAGVLTSRRRLSIHVRHWKKLMSNWLFRKKWEVSVK